MSTNNTTPRATGEAVAWDSGMVWSLLRDRIRDVVDEIESEPFRSSGYEWRSAFFGDWAREMTKLLEDRFYTHPAPRGRVVKLNQWQVVDNNDMAPTVNSLAHNEQTAREFAKWHDEKFPLDAPHRVMRLALVDADAGEHDDVAEARAEALRLARLIDATAAHWLALTNDIPIAWEGAIDEAMRAACEKIRELNATLAEMVARETARESGKNFLRGIAAPEVFRG